MYDEEEIIKGINGIHHELGKEFQSKRNLAYMKYLESGNEADKAKVDTWNEAGGMVGEAYLKMLLLFK